MEDKKPVIHDLDQLLPDYARYRRWMCDENPGLAALLQQGNMVRDREFLQIAAEFQVILLDAYGVLTLGDGPIPGAAVTVQALKAMGKTVRMVTNNASQSPEKLLDRARQMGFPFESGEVITSGMTVKDFVAASPWRNAPYVLVGTPESREAYAPDPQQWMVGASSWSVADARYLLMCSNRDYYRDPLLQGAVAALLGRGNIPIVLANPDLVAPEGDGRMNPVAGYTVARWAEAYAVSVVGLGKPFPAIFQQAQRGLEGVDPSQVLMVGDTLDTDILGGIAMGYRTCLTASGIYRGLGWEVIEALCDRKGILPDFMVADIGRAGRIAS